MKHLIGLAACAVMFLGVPDFARGGMIYRAFLDGPSESPPVPSPGIGFALIELDLSAHTLFVKASFSGLVATTTAAHIHAATAVPFEGTAGVATQVPFFDGFPIGVTEGTYERTFDTTLASTWNPAYITANGGTTAGAEAALAKALAEGRAYFNIHTTFRPTGEIRGFLQAVPEPTTIALAVVGGMGLFLGRRRLGRK